MGKPSENIAYCKKQGDWLDFGEEPKDVEFTGGRTGGEAKAAKYTKLIELAEEHDFAQIKKHYSTNYWQNYGTMKRIAMDNPKKVDILDKLDNEWIYGATGLGKSSNARMENPGCYIKSHNKWWLGYKGEDVVLIDDVSQTEANWLGEHLKQWADHYPFPAETKGDGMFIRPKRIIVTSNYSIEELWGHDPHLCESLLRRFKSRHITNPFPRFFNPAYDGIPADYAEHSAHSEEEKHDAILIDDEEEKSDSFID